VTTDFNEIPRHAGSVLSRSAPDWSAGPTVKSEEVIPLLGGAGEARGQQIINGLFIRQVGAPAGGLLLRSDTFEMSYRGICA